MCFLMTTDVERFFPSDSILNREKCHKQIAQKGSRHGFTFRGRKSEVFKYEGV
jgi:hypothetical protein